MRLATASVLCFLLAGAEAVPRGPAGAAGSPVCDPACPEKEVCIPSQDDNAGGRCFRPNDKCGGFGGILCRDTKNFKCIDDPRDKCDPLTPDCPGVCVPR